MAIIGKGSFGIVIKPAILCDGTYDDNYISKLFYGKDNIYSADVEWELLQKIEKIDYGTSWTLGLLERCDISINTLPKNITNNVKSVDSSKIPQIIVKYGGQDYNTLLNDDNFKIKFTDFLETMSEMMMGLSKLHQSGLIHRDIKPANILYDKRLNRSSMIDFGLSCAFEDVFDIYSKNVLGYKYPFYSPEFRFANHIYDIQWDNLDQYIEYFQYQQNFDLIIDECVANITSIAHEKKIYENNKWTYKCQLANFMKKYKEYLEQNRNILLSKMNKNKLSMDQLISYTLETLAEKTDVYSLGIFISMMYHKNKIKDIYPSQKKDFEIILSQMKNMNPYSRPDIKTVLMEVNDRLLNGSFKYGGSQTVSNSDTKNTENVKIDSNVKISNLASPSLDIEIKKKQMKNLISKFK